MFRRRRRAKEHEASASEHMEGNVSPRTRARWSQNVSSTLCSPRGVSRFRHFLAERQEPVPLHTVEFWEACNSLLHDNNLSGAEKRESAKRLAERVDCDDLRVNLDEGQLHRIRSATKSSELKAALREAMQTICNKDPDLGAAYSEFTEILNQSPN